MEEVYDGSFKARMT